MGGVFRASRRAAAAAAAAVGMPSGSLIASEVSGGGVQHREELLVCTRGPVRVRHPLRDDLAVPLLHRHLMMLMVLSNNLVVLLVVLRRLVVLLVVHRLELLVVVHSRCSRVRQRLCNVPLLHLVLWGHLVVRHLVVLLLLGHLVVHLLLVWRLHLVHLLRRRERLLLVVHGLCVVVLHLDLAVRVVHHLLGLPVLGVVLHRHRLPVLRHSRLLRQMWDSH